MEETPNPGGNARKKDMDMREAFQNKSQVSCTFTEDGVSFGGKEQEVFFPYSCIDTISMSLLGILQVNYRSKVCTFAVDRPDRARVKEMIRYAKEAMKTAPDAEIRTIDLTKGSAGQVDPSLPPEEQLHQYKALFIQGVISKEEYEAHKHRIRGN